MKKNALKQVAILAAFLILAASFASCNKGYGCPTNFKVVKTTISVLK